MKNNYSYSYALKNFTSLLTKVNDTGEIVTIKGNRGKDVVLISKDQFTSLQESIHLFNSPVNAKRLQKVISNALKRKTKPMTIEQLKQKVGLSDKKKDLHVRQIRK